MRKSYLLFLGLAACDAPAPPLVPAPQASASPTNGATPALQWTVRAACPLRYRVLVTNGQEMGALDAKLPRPTPNLMGDQELVVSDAGGNQVRMHLATQRTAFVEGDTRGPWMPLPGAEDVLFTNHGSRFEGSGSMWIGNGSGLELAFLWPSLPAEARVGASAAWRLPNSNGDMVERGPVKATGQTQAGGWLLSATWNENVAGIAQLPQHPHTPQLKATKVTTTGELLGRATWEVTANGRLLRADVVRDSDLQVAFGDATPQHHRMITRTQATLIHSCDGVAADPPEIANSIASRAGDVWAAVVRGVNARKSVLAYFAPALVGRHEGGLDRTLRQYVEAHTIRALGPPTMVPKALRNGQQLVLTLSATRPAGGHSTNQLEGEVVFDVSADPPRIIRIKIVDPIDKTPPKVLLEIDGTQIVFRR